MLYEIGHSLQYDYSAPVSLSPHTVRLFPRSDGSQRLMNLRWEILPVPGVCVRNVDLYGNDVIQAWFNAPTRNLSIRIKSQVETFRKNSFDYLSAPMRFPVDYGQSSTGLAACLNHVDPDPALESFCQELRAEVPENAWGFPFLLCQRLHALFKKERREDGAPRTPTESWALKSGACRDLAVLFMDCCRREGFASRFVSGYYYEDEADDKQRDLHAWAEVYIEGGGWRGYDPSTGLALADRHIVLAEASMPQQAAPVDGSFGGTGISSKFRYAVSITRLK